MNDSTDAFLYEDISWTESSVSGSILTGGSVKPEKLELSDAEGELSSLPYGPIFKIPRTQLDFETVVTRLVNFERENGFSTIEMFKKWLGADWRTQDEMDDWFTMFLFFMHAEEVNQYACDR